MFINFRPLQIICFFEQYALKTGKIKGRWDADLTIKFVSPGQYLKYNNFTRISQSLIFEAEYYSGVEDPDRQ